MKLVCRPILYGIMAYWDAVDDAFLYNVTLYIDDRPISKIVNERTELYHTFTGLASLGSNKYYVLVEAEDRQGNIIGYFNKVECNVQTYVY